MRQQFVDRHGGARVACQDDVHDARLDPRLHDLKNPVGDQNVGTQHPVDRVDEGDGLGAVAEHYRGRHGVAAEDTVRDLPGVDRNTTTAIGSVRRHFYSRSIKSCRLTEAIRVQYTIQPKLYQGRS